MPRSQTAETMPPITRNALETAVRELRETGGQLNSLFANLFALLQMQAAFPYDKQFQLFTTNDLETLRQFLQDHRATGADGTNLAEYVERILRARQN